MKRQLAILTTILAAAFVAGPWCLAHAEAQQPGGVTLDGRIVSLDPVRSSFVLAQNNASASPVTVSVQRFSKILIERLGVLTSGTFKDLAVGMHVVVQALVLDNNQVVALNARVQGGASGGAPTDTTTSGAGAGAPAGSTATGTAGSSSGSGSTSAGTGGSGSGGGVSVGAGASGGGASAGAGGSGSGDGISAGAGGSGGGASAGAGGSGSGGGISAGAGASGAGSGAGAGISRR